MNTHRRDEGVRCRWSEAEEQVRVMSGKTLGTGKRLMKGMQSRCGGEADCGGGTRRQEGKTQKTHKTHVKLN